MGPGQTYTTLTAAISNYNTHCLSGPPGSYTVKVSIGGCTSATSAAVAVVITAVGQVNGGSAFTLAPNPVSDRSIIRHSGANSVFKCVLYDLSGKKLSEYGPFASGFEIDMKGFAAGMYILDIIDTRRNKVERWTVIKK